MKTVRKKWMMLLLLSMAVLLLFTGCKASKKKVLSSSYYKELKKENNRLKKENKTLQSKVDKENDLTADEQRSADYLEKIARDHLVKLEVGYADRMEDSKFIEDEAVFSMATAIAQRADKVSRYSPDEISQKFGPGYQYVLYDEDNAVYEIIVYDGNYVVFTDLPDNVYYAYNASAIGEAFLHYKNGYPNSSLMHRLADTPLITDKKGHFFENDVAFSSANFIDQMSKKKTDEETAKKQWGKKASKKIKKAKEYIFHHHGNTMELVIYDEYFTITNMNGKTVWYHAQPETVTKLKEFFKVKKTDKSADEETTESDISDSHYDEVEAEDYK
ncbi:MAG: septum formation initiator family protein [Eubacterium sp.]|nr:septum formation initiator family protein [Eubacterium sp.]MDD7208889.1 hypothetical protein [Lachnospiraceae bacterium]MDY5497855.1 hypothetical protein [Anaerobutyricum sp.]